jgi:DnaJ-class molecular chaperone
MGKGDTYRPVDKKKYDRNFLRIFGEKCWQCNGTGKWPGFDCKCPNCRGIGYVEKEKTI